jgi:hypothetical protein
VENRNWLTTVGATQMLADVLFLRMRNVAASARDINHLICLLLANVDHAFRWQFNGSEIVLCEQRFGNVKGHSGL